MLLWIGLVAALLLLALFLRNPHLVQDVYYVHQRKEITRRVKAHAEHSYLIVDYFLEQARAQPHKPLVLFGDESYTYRQADELSNKAARALLQSGRVAAGDTVALYLPNGPMFLWLYLGLAKIGCPVSFLNYNIRSRSMLHCFNRSGATVLVAAEGWSPPPTNIKTQYSAFILRYVGLNMFRAILNRFCRAANSFFSPHIAFFYASILLVEIKRNANI